MEFSSLTTLPWNPLAVVGSSGSGKTHFLRELAKHQPNLIIADERVIPKRSRVSDLATEYRKKVMPQKADQVLELLNLEKCKNLRFHELTPAQASAACLFPALAVDAPVYGIDMLLEWVDWEVARRVWEALIGRCQKGAKVIIATHSPFWLSQCEGFVLVKNQKLAHSGSLQQALSEISPVEYVIESEDGDALAEMLEPYQIQLEQRGSSFAFSAPSHDGLALSLLLQGYGKVQIVKAQFPDTELLLSKLLST
jgi:ABC-type lipoprotein export system ATPase subunit